MKPTTVQELPWDRLTFAHFGWAAMLQILLILLAVYYCYISLVPHKQMGALMMRPGLKYRNYPFYFAAAGWTVLLWLALSRIRRDFVFWAGTGFPREFVEDVMMQSVIRSTGSFLMYFLGELGILKMMFNRQEIREKGLKNGVGFVHWQFITHGDWVGPGALRVYYHIPKRRFLFFSAVDHSSEDELESFLWEMKPEQEPEVRRQLAQMMPDRFS